jgi:APA family basic amino acid/polyamine antiporter
MALPKQKNFLVRTKPLDAMLAETEQKEYKMVRALGPLQITLVGIGATLGAGIFATIGTAAAGDAFRPGAGPSLMVSFMLTAVICSLVAICYAELASMIPISGSAYTYSYATLGELVAWIIGWDLVIEYGVSAVAVAISWSSYFTSFLGGIGINMPAWLTMNFGTAMGLDPVHRDPIIAAAPKIFDIPIVFNLPAAAVVVGISLLLMWGITQTAKMNAAMVLVNICTLLLFIIVGCFWVHPHNWIPFAPHGIAGISAGAAIVFFSYIGFDAVSTVAEETRDPQRSLPIGILSSLAIVSLFYIAVSAVFSGLLPFSVLMAKMGTPEAASPLVMALNYASTKLGWIAGILAVGAVVATTAVLLVVILGQTRIFAVMARDGLLPVIFSKLHPKFRTPIWPTIITGSAVALCGALASLDVIIDLTNIGTLFAFILVCSGVIALRLSDPSRQRKFKVPGGLPWAIAASIVLIIGACFLPAGWGEKAPILLIAIAVLWIFNEFTLPILGIAACAYLIANLPITSLLRFVAWLNIGLVIYCSYGVSNSRLQKLYYKVDSEEDVAAQNLNMAIMGMFLAIAGVMLAVGVRAMDIFVESMGGLKSMSASALWHHASTIFHVGGWVEISWFFIIPLVGNGLCLCPLLSWRLHNARSHKKAVIMEKRRTQAFYICMIITALTVVYLLGIFGHRLISK